MSSYRQQYLTGHAFKENPADYLTCGHCAKEFVLENIRLFIAHKAGGCDSWTHRPDPHRPEFFGYDTSSPLTCSTCSRVFMTARGLLQHVQKDHLMNICLQKGPLVIDDASIPYGVYSTQPPPAHASSKTFDKNGSDNKKASCCSISTRGDCDEGDQPKDLSMTCSNTLGKAFIKCKDDGCMVTLEPKKTLRDTSRQDASHAFNRCSTIPKKRKMFVGAEGNHSPKGCRSGGNDAIETYSEYNENIHHFGTDGTIHTIHHDRMCLDGKEKDDSHSSNESDEGLEDNHDSNVSVYVTAAYKEDELCSVSLYTGTKCTEKNAKLKRLLEKDPEEDSSDRPCCSDDTDPSVKKLVYQLPLVASESPGFIIPTHSSLKSIESPKNKRDSDAHPLDSPCSSVSFTNQNPNSPECSSNEVLFNRTIEQNIDTIIRASISADEYPDEFEVLKLSQFHSNSDNTVYQNFSHSIAAVDRALGVGPPISTEKKTAVSSILSNSINEMHTHRYTTLNDANQQIASTHMAKHRVAQNLANNIHAPSLISNDKRHAINICPDYIQQINIGNIGNVGNVDHVGGNIGNVGNVDHVGGNIGNVRNVDHVADNAGNVSNVTDSSFTCVVNNANKGHSNVSDETVTSISDTNIFIDNESVGALSQKSTYLKQTSKLDSQGAPGGAQSILHQDIFEADHRNLGPNNNVVADNITQTRSDASQNDPLHDANVPLDDKGEDGPMLKKRRYPTSRPFKCDHCEQAFNQRIHLKKHMSKHTGVKPFKCEHCDYSTVERSHLKVHCRIHTGEKPYQCRFCDYATAQNSTLKIHLKRHHDSLEQHTIGGEGLTIGLTTLQEHGEQQNSASEGRTCDSTAQSRNPAIGTHTDHRNSHFEERFDKLCSSLQTSTYSTEETSMLTSQGTIGRSSDTLTPTSSVNQTLSLNSVSQAIFLSDV